MQDPVDARKKMLWAYSRQAVLDAISQLVKLQGRVDGYCLKVWPLSVCECVS